MKIIGFSEELYPMISFIDETCRGNNLKNHISKMDVVVCTAPLTKHTKKLFDKSLLSKMKDQSILVNVSRGSLIDPEALLDEKINSKFLGIGLDVTDPDPLPKNHKLRKLRNIIITNHSSGLSDNNRLRSKNLMIENISRFCNGMDLLNVVDKKKGY
jgi:phosphoglycerate dehydrogenase-like enzyme